MSAIEPSNIAHLECELKRHYVLLDTFEREHPPPLSDMTPLYALLATLESLTLALERVYSCMRKVTRYCDWLHMQVRIDTYREYLYMYHGASYHLYGVIRDTPYGSSASMLPVGVVFTQMPHKRVYHHKKYINDNMDITLLILPQWCVTVSHNRAELFITPSVDAPQLCNSLNNGVVETHFVDGTATFHQLKMHGGIRSTPGHFVGSAHVSCTHPHLFDTAPAAIEGNVYTTPSPSFIVVTNTNQWHVAEGLFMQRQLFEMALPERGLTYHKNIKKEYGVVSSRTRNKKRKRTPDTIAAVAASLAITTHWGTFLDVLAHEFPQQTKQYVTTTTGGGDTTTNPATVVVLSSGDNSYSSSTTPSIVQQQHRRLDRTDKLTRGVSRPCRPLSPFDLRCLLEWCHRMLPGWQDSDDAFHVMSRGDFCKFWAWYGPIVHVIRHNRATRSLWFNGFIVSFLSPQLCVNLLASQPSGAFILRFSTQSEAIVISYKTAKTGTRHVFLDSPKHGSVSSKSVLTILKRQRELKKMFVLDVKTGEARFVDKAVALKRVSHTNTTFDRAAKQGYDVVFV